ncbi:hypothetical protein [Maribellus mangrovi]|uniref:hypothetical protein n=1 Tax=Maribellus mangrovi TaxID=3133146 RepID=UPI0030EC0E9C
MKKNSFLSKGGIEHIYERDELVNILAEVLESQLYNSVIQNKSSNLPDLRFKTNKEFWDSVIAKRVDESQTLMLNKFHITEWLPSSPGKYHTKIAKEKREWGMKHVARFKDTVFTGYEQYAGNLKYKDMTPIELAPTGKEGMILGGYGSIRLASKNINNKKTFFLGATSSGISHEGIPLVFEEDVYKELIKYFKGNYGIIADIIGSISILPKEASLIEFDPVIPRYCFYVKDFKFKLISKESEILSSIAISFANPYNPYLKSFSFCSFNPDPKDDNLKIAVEWLNDYAKRYSESDKTIITGDFDEIYEHFSNVDFKLNDIMNGRISIETLKRYGKDLNITINENVLGDKFQNISGSTIVNRSNNKPD